MERTVFIVVFAVTVIHCYGAVPIQMPEHAEIQQPDDDDLQAQVRELQRNMTDIWTYIQELRTAVSHHLKHLRLHQEALETSVHKLEHAHEALSGSHSHDNSHGDSHHHSGEHHSHGSDDSHSGDHGSDHHSHTEEHHSHSGEHHSHTGDQHSHSGEHHSHTGDQHSHSGDQHSHSGEHHSHTGDHSHSGDQHPHSDEHHSHSGDQHSHSGEHHSHSGDQHSHSGEQHSHSGDQHSHSGNGYHTHSESHSHSSHDHSKEDSGHSHSHGSDHPPEPDHKESHETEDLQQTIQQVAIDPVAEPVVVATTRQEHYHHHHREQKPTSRPSSAGSMDLLNENSFHHHHHHHHHDHQGSASRRNRTVELPKYSDYDVYDFAVCNVQPNRAIPEEQQQNVGGQVTLWQKKTGGPLNIHVQLQGFQMGDHHGHHGAHQAIQQEENNETPQEVVIHKHGFHIHAYGNLSNGCQSAGPHYNPKGLNHGGPTALVRHVGDLGNIECDDKGIANLLFSDDVASLRGPYSIVGRAIVIHSNQDDLGLGGDAESLKTGNAGTRIACCVIQGTEKLPIRLYRPMKSATQYQNY